MDPQQALEIARLDQTTRMLAEAKSLPEVVAIRDKAEAARAYAKSVKAGLELQNHAAELKLRAERKAGAFLAALKLHGGNRHSKSHAATLKLQDLGINKYESQRWQNAARVPDDEFELYIESAKRIGTELTSRGLQQIAKKHRAAGQATRRKARPTYKYNRVRSQVLGHGELGDAMCELQNHQQLLTSILTPICQDDTNALKLAERRVVARLLREMEQLLLRLITGHST